MFTLENIINVIETTFPLSDACLWDFTGLQIKAKNKRHIKKVLICLDITNEVFATALATNVDLIITHHPFIFAKNINDDSISHFKKALYNKILKADINVYALHTNFDKSPIGMNMLMANDLEIRNPFFLDKEKLVVVGDLHKKVSLTQIINDLKLYFNVKHIQFIGDKKKAITTIALSAGASGDCIKTLSNNIDVLITGEMKWNNIIESIDKKINVILIGHFMEAKFIDFIFVFLRKKLLSNLEIIKYSSSNPVLYF